jgi:hypothetical protein
MVEIVMNADADVIKAAYEARVEVDKLLALRQEAYRRIAELETKVEEVIGQPGLFVFPPPPLAVAGLETATPRPRKTARPPGEAATAPAAAEAAKAAPPQPSSARAAAAETPAASSPDKLHPARGDAPERPAPRSGSSSRSHGA